MTKVKYGTALQGKTSPRWTTSQVKTLRSCLTRVYDDASNAKFDLQRWICLLVCVQF